MQEDESLMDSAHVTINLGGQTYGLWAVTGPQKEVLQPARQKKRFFAEQVVASPANPKPCLCLKIIEFTLM